MEQFIAELEVFVGERTQKERTELLGLKEVELKRLIKYAKLAATRKENEIVKGIADFTVIDTLIEAKETPAPKQRKK